MRYYHCVNCGHYEDLKKERERGIVCSSCGYDAVMDMDKEEWMETVSIRPWLLEGKTSDEWFGTKPILPQPHVKEKRKRRTKEEMTSKKV